VNIQRDFEEFLRLLNEQRAEFVIVGGYAVAFHGYVRATDDMDLFFRNTAENIVKIRRALEDFGLPTTDAQAKEFADIGIIVRVGSAPVRVEMINTISGLTFDGVWERRVAGTYGETSVSYISRLDLLHNKRNSGRPKDLADVDELGGNRDSRRGG
jgi:predicted nucleotidyltransferase